MRRTPRKKVDTSHQGNDQIEEPALMSVADSNKKTRLGKPTPRRAAPAAETELMKMPLFFEHQTDKERNWTGETHEVRIVGNSLRDPQDREAACYLAGTWRIGDDRFRFIQFPSAVMVRLENEGQPSKEFGPLENVRLVDGVIRYGSQLQEHLARFEQASRGWRLWGDQSLWTTIVFLPAPPS
jgi:hypothetical protein